MLGKLFRSRPIQLAFIAGLSVYTILTIGALFLRNTDTSWVYTQQGKRSEPASNLAQWYHKQDKAGQGEKLDKILEMLNNIKPDGVIIGGAPQVQQSASLISHTGSVSNRTSNDNDVLRMSSSGVKRTKVDLRKVMENPGGHPVPSGKIPLDQIEYMREPLYQKSVSRSSITGFVPFIC